MMDNRKRHTAVLLMLIFCVTCTNCNFQVTPPAIASECVNKAVTLTWTVESFMSVGVVRWNYNLSTLIMRQIGPTATPVPQGSYVGRVENGSNSDLIIKSPLTSDTGGYQCSVTYNNGTQVLSDVVSLYIYDNWAVTLNITERKNGQSATLTSNVDDPTVQQTWSTGAQGSSITVTKDGVYTLCISGGRAKCLDPSSTNCTSYYLKIEGSTTTVSTINLSTDDSTITASETSTKNIMQSISTTQTSVSLSDTSTIEGNTLSGSTESVNTKSKSSTAPVVTTSPSGLSEKMIIIISTVSVVGGIFLIVMIVIFVLCCKQRTGTTDKMKIKNKHDRLQATNGKNKDLNSNYNQAQKIKYESRSKMRDSTSTNLNKMHPQNDIWYGGRMPRGVEFSRSQKYHQQNYFHRNQNHYRKQNSAYCLPYADPRNVMYYQSGYYEDMSGYSRAGPYRMQQFYPKSYSRQDIYTEDGLERRIGHRRGEYEDNWGKNDTLY